MSEVQRRTVFYDDTGGYIRFMDWALVTTQLGTMVEPFQVDERHGVGINYTQFDPTDSEARIDEMRRIDADKLELVLSGGDHHLHGGTMRPKTGR